MTAASAPDPATDPDAARVPFRAHLGVEVTHIEPGLARVRLPKRPEFDTRAPGVVHGGVIASLIDMASANAVNSLRTEADADWAGVATTDLNVTYLAAARSDLEAEARVLRASRRLAFLQVDVRDAEGALVAVGRTTFSITRREPRPAT